MYDIIGILFGTTVWTTFILFVCLLVSKSWFILIFILVNIVFFVLMIFIYKNKYDFMASFGSFAINGICKLKNLGINIF